MGNAKFFLYVVGLLWIVLSVFGPVTMLAVMAVMWIPGLVTLGVGYFVLELMR